ncbi:unnamed protein product [Symbiodinium necroappetens]|uniref:Uncharacterized protein n=1 Tax=Symbiodinium necroappetens TaxID=1628268 RepID=A0A812UJZ2_9DINO|nr:unnamed protein product [Symbiodinium necroappetens]
MVPDVISSFPDREELQEAVLASSNVWLVVSFLPWRWLPGAGAAGALCSDGVNPFSLFCFYDYARQLWSRDCQTTAPSHLHHGHGQINLWVFWASGGDRIFFWSCDGVMKAVGSKCRWRFLGSFADTQSKAASARHGGILDRIYPIWNCTVMKALLCPKDRHIWVSPTVGGRLDVKNLLRFSDWFIGHQWQEGYSHAKDLDAAGYWAELARRPGL